MKLEDRITVVSGGAQGIGSGIARLFSNEGARVMILDINIETGSRTASSIANAEFIHCDVARKQPSTSPSSRSSISTGKSMFV